jgi:dihydrofolate reductase
MNNRKIIGLIACDPNGVIGNKGKLPWHYPEELAHFRSTTHKNIMIMGRKTFESIPEETLAERFSIVFSRKIPPSLHSSDPIVFVSSLEEFHKLTPPPCHNIFMIGGNEIANLFCSANLIHEFILSKIHKIYEGDTYFPFSLLNNWDQTTLRKEKDFTIYNYKKPIS